MSDPLHSELRRALLNAGLRVVEHVSAERPLDVVRIDNGTSVGRFHDWGELEQNFPGGA